MATDDSGMPLTELQRCTALGFKHHVFISWPHQIEERGAEFVRALAQGLQNKFETYGGGSVYVDDRLRPGYRWDSELRLNLCRSAVTIYIVVPSFFLSEYCRTEWAIADRLQGLRLPSARSTAFIPVVLARDMRLPHEVADLHLLSEFLPVLVHSRKVEKHPSWNALMESLRIDIFDTLSKLGQAPLDWDAQEKLALAEGPKHFTWVPPRFAPSASKRDRGALPQFVVEKKSA